MMRDASHAANTRWWCASQVYSYPEFKEPSSELVRVVPCSRCLVSICSPALATFKYCNKILICLCSLWLCSNQLLIGDAAVQPQAPARAGLPPWMVSHINGWRASVLFSTSNKLHRPAWCIVRLQARWPLWVGEPKKNQSKVEVAAMCIFQFVHLSFTPSWAEMAVLVIYHVIYM